MRRLTVGDLGATPLQPRCNPARAVDNAALVNSPDPSPRPSRQPRLPRPPRQSGVPRSANPIPPITYPESLPVSTRRDEIARALRDHQVIIVCGETGSGKTTQLPKIALQLGRG